MVSVTGASAGTPSFVTLGAAARIPAGARATGELPASRALQLGVVLSVRDPGALQALATAVSMPGNPEHGQRLGPAGFARRFGPSAATISKVSAIFRRSGLKVGPVSANHLVIPVTGSAGRIDRVFRTHIEGYRLADGSAGFAASSAPAVPSDLVGRVSAVLGLDDLVQPQSRVSVSAAPAGRASAVQPAGGQSEGPVACPDARRDAINSGAWTDSDVANAYGLNNLYAKGDVAAGQTIALFELEPFRRADLATFDRCYFGASHVDLVSSIAVDGYSLSGAGTGEAILDVENLSALAPAAHIVVYDAPNTTYGAIDAYNEIVSQDRANIVTTSWGECESALETSAPGAQQLENILFEEAAAEGQTVFAATGDTGSDDCASTPFSSTSAVQPYLSVDDPASQPFVVSVGGTSLSSDQLPRPAANGETVWNDGANGGASGGGSSLIWPAPAWQSGVAGISPGANREVPDVSATADEQLGITVYSSAFGGSGGRSGGDDSAGWSTIGGTSSATPIWAAIAAEIAASAPAGTSCGALPVRAGGADLGFIAPALYAVASTPAGYSGSFIDVTSGSNDLFGVSAGSYAAGAGYDRATGLGAPIVAEAQGSGGLAGALCAQATGSPLSGANEPVVTGLSPGSGPITGGTTVVASLASPLPTGSTVTASLGATTASVVAAAGSSVTLVTPASPLTPGSPSTDGAGPVQLVLTVAGPSGTASSLVSPAGTYQYVDTGVSPTATPVVSGIGPSGGSRRGGDTVTVYGSSFAPPLSVTFGGVRARKVTVVSNHELRVVTPSAAVVRCARGRGFDPANNCQSSVVVSDAAGSSPVSPVLPPASGRIVFSPEGVVSPTTGHEVAPTTTEFDFAPEPRITGISPNPGDARGLSPVTITGRGFNLNTFDWVNFGPPTNSASEQVEIAWITGSEIRIVPPPSPARMLAGGVSVQSVVGRSNAVSFGYAKVPIVSGLSVKRGRSGTRLTVSGDNLAGAVDVVFVSAANLRVYRTVTAGLVHAAPTRLVVVVPPGLRGPVHVEPCSPTGCEMPTAEDTFVEGG